MTKDHDKDILPAPIAIACGGDRDDLLSREWLIANRIGAYAASTVLGCNTRRYHGLLVAATQPPVGRIVALSCLLDQFCLAGQDGREETFDLSTFEFVGTFQPDAGANLAEFRDGPAVSFVYRCGPAEVIKQIVLSESANAVAVRYRVTSGPAGRLRIRPFLALRDFHGLRKFQYPSQLTYLHYYDGIRVEDRGGTSDAVHLSASAAADDERGLQSRKTAIGASRGGEHARQAEFLAGPQWWYRFRYRADIARGQEGLEDLYTPGCFQIELTPEAPVQLTASLSDSTEVNFGATVRQKRRRLAAAVRAVGPDADETARRLAVASDVFVVSRLQTPGRGSKEVSKSPVGDLKPRPLLWGSETAVAPGDLSPKLPNVQPGTTIVAGYPWFADWGRDAMIALPGLTLATGRCEEALAVLRTFAGAISAGMIPNRFDDYGGPPHYNSIDASLWFIIAAERTAAACGGPAGWSDNELGPATGRILSAYHDGTRFDIRADADGLLVGGSPQTQLTWMDVSFDGVPITPRHGKCVEVNALWHAALRIAARRCPEAYPEAGELADRVAAAFAPTFWNERAGCLYDCVREDQKDDSIRPNQILAVALPDSPLDPPRQRAVVEVVQRELLTPYGLRTLSPKDPRYRGRYGTSWESRDRAYHQGTVWPWLMGPFVEAYLKVHEFSDAARAQAREWLSGFDEHLRHCGVGFISEVFDGDPPHEPGGCFAQAWSVAEILRAKQLVDSPPEQ